MKTFFFFCLAICVGTLMGLFSTPPEEKTIPLSPGERAVSVYSLAEPVRRQAKRVIRRPSVKEFGAHDRATVVDAAKKLAPHTRVPAKVLVAIAEQETAFGENYGKPGRGVSRARSISEQVLLDVFAREYQGISLDKIKVSPDAAFGLVQARPALFLHHTGMSVDFGGTPKVLLHGTEEYRGMSRSERIAGTKDLQRKLGLRGDDVDGSIGPKTLDAIKESVGARSFDRVAKYRLVKKYFADQIAVKTSRSRDKVFQRICLAQGKDPNKTEYFIPNLWDPLHALAYASVHLEDDLRLAGNLNTAIAAYYTGLGSAKQGCRDGIWYKNQIVAKSRKYARDLAS